MTPINSPLPSFSYFQEISPIPFPSLQSPPHTHPFELALGSTSIKSFFNSNPPFLGLREEITDEKSPLLKKLKPSEVEDPIRKPTTTIFQRTIPFIPREEESGLFLDPEISLLLESERLYLNQIFSRSKFLSPSHKTMDLSDIPLPKNRLIPYLKGRNALQSPCSGVTLYSFNTSKGAHHEVVEKKGNEKEILNEIKAINLFQSLELTSVKFPLLLSVTYPTLPSIEKISLIMTRQPGITLNDWWMNAVRNTQCIEDAVLATEKAGRSFGELHSKRVSTKILETQTINTLCEDLLSNYNKAKTLAETLSISMPNNMDEIEQAINDFKSETHFGGLCHGDGHSGNILYDKEQGLSFIDLDAISRHVDNEGNSRHHFVRHFFFNYEAFLNNTEMLPFLGDTRERLIQAFQQGHNATFRAQDSDSSVKFLPLYLYYKKINLDLKAGKDAEIVLNTNFKLLAKKAAPGKIFPSL